MDSGVAAAAPTAPAQGRRLVNHKTTTRMSMLMMTTMDLHNMTHHPSFNTTTNSSAAVVVAGGPTKPSTPTSQSQQQQMFTMNINGKAMKPGGRMRSCGVPNTPIKNSHYFTFMLLTGLTASLLILPLILPPLPPPPLLLLLLPLFILAVLLFLAFMPSSRTARPIHKTNPIDPPGLPSF